MTEVKNADEAASIVLEQAMLAADQGTFSVGGAIICNATGKVIKVMHNNVLKPLKNGKTFTYDPTAHGERQLVYWYYENKDKDKLPEPSELTIVTTLDPCVMCTGALLAAGFNVGVVAIDDFAGINYDSKFTFDDLPEKLCQVAKSKFGYYACGKDGEPSTYRRNYMGSDTVVFKNTEVSAERLMGCDAIFKASVETVRKNSSNSGLDPGKLSDPAKLPDDSPIKKKYQEIYSDAFKVKVPPRLPNTQLLNVLQRVKNAKSGAKNAVALLDTFGNVVLCLADSFDESPVHTAFMNVTQFYATTRFELMNNEDKKIQEDAEQYLTHPKYGTFVFLYAPNPSDATTLMTLGAYGSTMEGPIPQVFPANFQYYYPPQDGSSIEELRSVMMKLPPFYTSTAQISAMEVGSTNSESMPIPIYLYKAENPPRYHYTTNPTDTPGQDWTKAGIAFFAFQQHTVGATAVHQFSAGSPQRYGFDTSSLPAPAWTNDNKDAFYVLTSASNNSVPVYQYHQILPGGLWNMFYSLDPNVKGWINDGITFHVLGG
ncbi:MULTISPECIES: nucleoside deaminase [unclassified Microcoleus]|uniref:nucleoside deaminase n=1 Tax=unclassified Microcoleus TaxID=2642155 RepID=UPI002FCF9FD7